jgi:hypothetical protein
MNANKNLSNNRRLRRAILETQLGWGAIRHENWGGKYILNIKNKNGKKHRFFLNNITGQ